MSTVLSISGSPQPVSSTHALLTHVNRRIAGAGHTVTILPVRTLPAAPLLVGDLTHPAIIEAIGLAAAIDYVQAIGLEAIGAHEMALAATARDELRRLNAVTVFGPDESAGIVSFALNGVHPHDLGTILDEEGVAIRAGHHCAQPLMDHLGVPATARASFGLYSDETDIAALLRGIERTRRIFG